MTIVVLGGGIDRRGKLPNHVITRLKKAAEIFKKEKNVSILVCGKYSFLYSKKDLPAKTEAEAAKEYLLTLGIPEKKIYLENKSKDTIGNAYYAKKNYFIPKKEKRALIITSDFHLKRARFIFKKIFGKSYKIVFVATPSVIKEKEKVKKRQKELLEKTKKMLAPMKLGDHNYLRGKLYKIKFYREQRSDWVKKFVAQGK